MRNSVSAGLSTYASIMQTLQEREYVTIDRKRFIPSDRGRIVTAFLSNFFERYVEYGFTADLEAKLDAVSDGKMDWRDLMSEFWLAFSAAITGTKDLKIGEVIEALDEELYTFLFPDRGDGSDPRICQVCGNGRLSLKLGKFGAFVGCSNYPACNYTRPLAQAVGADGTASDGGSRELGIDPAGLAVSLKHGPYGSYVQLAPAVEGGKPKRVSLAKGMSASDIGLEQALKLLELPREIGPDPQTGSVISAGIGKFGPYLKCGDMYVQLPPAEDVLTIGMNRAIDLVAAKHENLAKRLIRDFGKHPTTGSDMAAYKGRFGAYLKSGKLMANLPKGVDAEAMSVEDAVKLLAESAKKAPAKKGKVGAKKKVVAKPKAATKPKKAKAT